MIVYTHAIDLYLLCSVSVSALLSTYADRQGVDISVTVCLCVCVCWFVCSLRLRISPARIKLAASNFARWFIVDVLGRKSPILRNVSPS